MVRFMVSMSEASICYNNYMHNSMRTPVYTTCCSVPILQVMFPAAHVTQRMEQTAAGLWPERGPAVEDTDTVPNTLLKVGATAPEGTVFSPTFTAS